jgi:hypothetical protein
MASTVLIKSVGSEPFAKKASATTPGAHQPSLFGSEGPPSQTPRDRTGSCTEGHPSQSPRHWAVSYTQTRLRSVRDSGCPILHTPYDRPGTRKRRRIRLPFTSYPAAHARLDRAVAPAELSMYWSRSRKAHPIVRMSSWPYCRVAIWPRYGVSPIPVGHRRSSRSSCTTEE